MSFCLWLVKYFVLLICDVVVMVVCPLFMKTKTQNTYDKKRFINYNQTSLLHLLQNKPNTIGLDAISWRYNMTSIFMLLLIWIYKEIVLFFVCPSYAQTYSKQAVDQVQEALTQAQKTHVLSQNIFQVLWFSLYFFHKFFTALKGTEFQFRNCV